MVFHKDHSLLHGTVKCYVVSKQTDHLNSCVLTTNGLHDLDEAEAKKAADIRFKQATDMLNGVKK